MAERSYIVSGLTLNYSGLFECKELYKIIDSWVADKKYDKDERLNTQLNRDKGRSIYLVLRPYRAISDYIKFELEIRISINNMEDVTVEIDGVKKTLNKGDVSIVFDGFLVTDYENKWENHAFLYVVRSIVDKYVYKFYTGYSEAQLASEVKHLYSIVKAYLNLHRSYTM